MKTIALKNWGDLDQFFENDIEQPEIGDNQVLVKQVATAIDPFDTLARTGYMAQENAVMPYVEGSVVSGTVEKVGSSVTRLKVGDRVAAAIFGGGAYAEYVSVNEDYLAVIPEAITFQQAAGLALGGQTGYKVLTEDIAPKAGEKVFIHGGGGAVGSVAVQKASSLGAEVYTSDLPDNFDYIQSLGDNIHTYDFRDSESLAQVNDMDHVLDTVGGPVAKGSIKLLKNDGKLRSLRGGAKANQADFDQTNIDAQDVFLPRDNHRTFDALLSDVAAGKIQLPRIYKEVPFNLENIIEGHTLQTEGKLTSGKYILDFN